MLATIEPMPMDYAQKRGTKTYFSSQAVETAHLQLIGLPPKPKTRFNLLETVIYLQPDITSAFEKNYTQEEVSVILRSSGIVSRDPDLKHFWRLYQAEKKNLKGKKNKPLKTSENELIASHSKLTQTNLDSAFASAETTSGKRKTHKKKPDETQKISSDVQIQSGRTVEETPALGSLDAIKTSSVIPEAASDDKPLIQSGAHFDLPPDTEDI